MWEPEPGWHALPGGTGTSTVGVWRAAMGGRPVVVKRLGAPGAHDPAALSDPQHVAYWRREADVLSTGLT
ncbi:MAG: phosphotransferase, partial [Actinomycetota bacterium]|nr:phosphotransferase [Actinomycetota bacterium]